MKNTTTVQTIRDAIPPHGEWDEREQALLSLAAAAAVTLLSAISSLCIGRGPPADPQKV